MEKIFVSYSRKDAQWVKRLNKHLRPLASEKGLEFWSDADISPGENWRDAINRSIESASAVILLVSPDYMASDFIAKIELPQLITVTMKRSLPLITIIVRPVAINKQLEKLETINPEGKALEELPYQDQEAVLAHAAECIQKWLISPGPKEKLNRSLDPHSRALNAAISVKGVSNSVVNVVGDINIFVHAEQKLRKGNVHGDE